MLEKEDIAQVEADNAEMASMAANVYGQASNQSKYVYRNFSKGETLVHKHYAPYVEPSHLERMRHIAIINMEHLLDTEKEDE
jgi:hypothetical protein